MPKSFDDQLAAVQGKIHIVRFDCLNTRMSSGLLYYWNRSESLHDAAKLIWRCKGPSEVAAMLVGMSIELLLKGIHVAFDKPIPQHHRLHDLCTDVGIRVSHNDRIVLQALSEHVIWAARYPNPKTAKQMAEAQRIFIEQRRKSGSLAKLYVPERAISEENCERLWKQFVEYYHKAREARIESVE